MAHYIDKDALVAEIERLISNGQTKLKESEECNDYESYVALAERIATCINVLSILDTLEVKEIDLEKESELIANGIMISVQANTYNTVVYNTKRNDFNHSHLMLAARKGIELGLSASNPITAADRGIANEIIFALNALGEEKMISYDKEIEWVMNKVKED